MKILSVKHILFVCMAMWGNHLWDSLALLTCHHCWGFRYHLRNRYMLLISCLLILTTPLTLKCPDRSIMSFSCIPKLYSLLIPMALKLWLCTPWQSSPACVNMLVNFRDNMLCPTGMSKYQQESSFSNLTFGFK